jgi:hypothetical protein
LRSLVGWPSEAYLVRIYAHIYGVSWPFSWIWRENCIQGAGENGRTAIEGVLDFVALERNMDPGPLFPGF